MRYTITREQADNFRKVIDYFRAFPPDRLDMTQGYVHVKDHSYQGFLSRVCIGCHLSICFGITQGCFYDYLSWCRLGADNLQKYFGVPESILAEHGAIGTQIFTRNNNPPSIFRLQNWDKSPADVFEAVLHSCNIS